jgi:hypothetical protein
VITLSILGLIITVGVLFAWVLELRSKVRQDAADLTDLYSRVVTLEETEAKRVALCGEAAKRFVDALTTDEPR